MYTSEPIDKTVLAELGRYKTVLAQLVERVAFNHKVTGSIPVGGTSFFISSYDL